MSVNTFTELFLYQIEPWNSTWDMWKYCGFYHKSMKFCTLLDWVYMRLLSHGANAKMTHIKNGGHFSTAIIEKQISSNIFINNDGRIANNVSTPMFSWSRIAMKPFSTAYNLHLAHKCYDGWISLILCAYFIRQSLGLLIISYFMNAHNFFSSFAGK